MFHNQLYLIGCPVWACDGWKGSLFPSKGATNDRLKHYSSVFSAVEGNSTFYGIPSLDTFRRWGDQAKLGFKFCLKFPKVISHDFELQRVDDPLKQFLAGLEILAHADRLGPTFLQMGPAFNRSKIDVLLDFFDRLPPQFPYALEVRHSSWFEGEIKRRLVDLLKQRNIDRVIFDSRTLFKGKPSDPSEEGARRRKPLVPIMTEVTGTSPMVRLIGKNNVESSEMTQAIEVWSELVFVWIQNGLKPIVFTHTPDDQYAPEFAMRFHNRLVERLKEDGCNELQLVDKWPYEKMATQKSLF